MTTNTVPRLAFLFFLTLLGLLLFISCMSSLSSRSLIKDRALEQAIRSEIGKPRGALTTEDLQQVTELTALDAGIESVEGIQYCDNLVRLILRDNRIHDLGPLRELTSLEYLNLGNNGINNIGPLRGVSNLQSLLLGQNSVTDLEPLSNLAKLEDLGLCGNTIRDLSPLIQNPGIGQGDVVWLCDIPQNDVAFLNQIQTLELQGVRVFVFERSKWWE